MAGRADAEEGDAAAARGGGSGAGRAEGGGYVVREVEVPKEEIAIREVPVDREVIREVEREVVKTEILEVSPTPAPAPAPTPTPSPLPSPTRTRTPTFRCPSTARWWWRSSARWRRSSA